jgi:hypothetical protein
VVVAAGAAGVGTGAAASSFFGSALNGSSFNGPLVALMPAADFAAGISDISGSAAFGGAAVSAAAAGVSTGLVSASLGASGVAVCAEAALGGAGTAAPAGSGAERQKGQSKGVSNVRRKKIELRRNKKRARRHVSKRTVGQGRSG